ncbi:hypothetical protein AB0D49_39150 [Streptomyces sp. NPDC048290]|uniref:hypothetical protein n=1 Tax=Streptomyces sp. NPDC048290 TaxID=3155811 RepID=UPI00342638B8
MLTTTANDTPWTITPHRIFRCVAVAYPQSDVRSIPLDTHKTINVHRALHWLKQRTSEITQQFDPAHAQEGQHWLTDEAEHERAVAYLTLGTGYQITLYDKDTCYVLVVHPPGATS